MKRWTIEWFFVASFLVISAARADYLEVRRSATLKDEPKSDASTQAQLKVGDTVTLLDEGSQKGGYYHIASGENVTGWIYRTLVRRYPGQPSDGSGTTSNESNSASGTQLSGATMKAHFISLGQGNSTLLEFSCGAVLIDAGGENEDTTKKLLAYLNSFFQRRSDLNKTIDTVFVTHTHIDHNRALRTVAENFTIKNYVHNGVLEGSGSPGANWMVKNANADGRHINVEAVSEADVEKAPKGTGRTSGAIDAVNCPGTDPEIHVVSGSYGEDPGWSSGAFDNGNNRGIVVRVDFGASSFLFPGDLQEDAIDSMLDYYKGTRTLDVDVLEVGHHGSHNATTEAELEVVTPKMAIISMGDLSSHKLWTAWQYGHPRKVVLDLLGKSVSDSRNKAGVFKVATGAKDFSDYSVKRAIYATGWDGTIVVKADPNRHYQVQTGQ